MLYILETVNSMDSFCSSFILYNFLVIIKRSLDVIQIMGPILAMVALTINFVRLTLNPEEKKYVKGIKNSLIATVILLLMPAIVNATMNLVDDSTTVGACWKSVENTGKVVKNKTK